MTKLALGAYKDDHDFWIDLGVMVGYREEFATTDNGDKAYIVVDLPNLGHMVEMTQIDFFRDGTCNWVVIDPNNTILVEPYKIGAI